MFCNSFSEKKEVLTLFLIRKATMNFKKAEKYKKSTKTALTVWYKWIYNLFCACFL